MKNENPTVDPVAEAAAQLIEDVKRFARDGFFSVDVMEWRRSRHDGVPYVIRRRLVRDLAAQIKVPFIVAETYYRGWGETRQHYGTSVKIPVRKSLLAVCGVMELFCTASHGRTVKTFYFQTSGDQALAALKVLREHHELEEHKAILQHYLAGNPSVYGG